MIISADRAKIFIWEGAAVFVGRLSDTSLHKHHAIQLCIGVGGPFQLLHNGAWVEANFANIPANVAHQLDASENAVAFALLDGAWVIGDNKKTVTISDDVIDLKLQEQTLDTVDDGRRLLDLIVGQGIPVRNIPSKRDARINQVLENLRDVGASQISADSCADMAGLSPSRFLHLFTQNVGLPFRRYVLWRRIIRAIEEVCAGGDLTMAAHAGGFADSAHFSRTFRETFGLSPSKLFKNSQYVQVIT